MGKRHKPEKIIGKLREAEIVMAQSEMAADACRRIEVAEQNRKRVERIWRSQGLKLPHKQPKRGRLWLNDGSCVRLRPEYPGHVWAYEFVEGRTT